MTLLNILSKWSGIWSAPGAFEVLRFESSLEMLETLTIILPIGAKGIGVNFWRVIYIFCSEDTE